MTPQEQLDRWVAGESVHNNDAPVQGGECCPDFSCCVPELQALKETREEFRRARQEGDTAKENALLTQFLGELLRCKTPEAGVILRKPAPKHGNYYKHLGKLIPE
jgi:hypothetical protein